MTPPNVHFGLPDGKSRKTTEYDFMRPPPGTKFYAFCSDAGVVLGFLALLVILLGNVAPFILLAYFIHNR